MDAPGALLSLNMSFRSEHTLHPFCNPFCNQPVMASSTAPFNQSAGQFDALCGQGSGEPSFGGRGVGGQLAALQPFERQGLGVQGLGGQHAAFALAPVQVSRSLGASGCGGPGSVAGGGGAVAVLPQPLAFGAAAGGGCVPAATGCQGRWQCQGQQGQ
mmetsp:Transcript_22465/g.57005  ORF Transcript_22465/g.57005 Transcript_22465/m.57005 type:complete len:158 (+) Transcript_22465:567-1040(+)